MGRKGYKGIAPVADNLFVINDDGDHVIHLCEVNYEAGTCGMMVIAGQPGIPGNEDNEVGALALISRPGRIQSDIFNRKCYFGSRTFRNVKVLSLEGAFPVSTLAISFEEMLPGADLDFNRILITPSGNNMVLIDRKGPYIVLVSNLSAERPGLSLLHTPGCGLKSPLQGACFPIFPHMTHPLWDTSTTITNDDITYDMTVNLDEERGKMNSDLDKSLPISVEHCFVAAGPRIWLIPISEHNKITLPLHLLAAQSDEVNSLPPPPGLKHDISTNSETHEEDGEENDSATNSLENNPYYAALKSVVTPCSMVCNLSSDFPKFLIHDMVPLTSNTLLVLNRHSRRTGVWQLTTKDSWKYQKKKDLNKFYKLRYLEGKDYVGPHGMTLSLDRKHLLVVETGSREDNQRGGYINLLSVHLTTGNQVRVGNSFALRCVRAEIRNWQERVVTASMNHRREIESPNGPELSYDKLYNMDGDLHPDRSDEGLQFRDHMKQFGKCKSSHHLLLLLLIWSSISEVELSRVLSKVR